MASENKPLEAGLVIDWIPGSRLAGSHWTGEVWRGAGQNGSDGQVC